MQMAKLKEGLQIDMELDAALAKHKRNILRVLNRASPDYARGFIAGHNTRTNEMTEIDKIVEKGDEI